MKILQRYILVDLIRVLLLVITVMTVLLVFVGVFREVTERGLGPLQVLQILPYVVPSLLPFTIPATLLLSVCVVYGRLAADHEITAARAAGINVMSLLAPAFFLGGALTVCSLLLNDQVIPWSMANIQRVVTLAMEDIFFDVLSAQHMVEYPEKGWAITVSGVDKENRRLIRPNLRYTVGREQYVAQLTEAVLRIDLETEKIILQPTDARIEGPGRVSIRLKEGNIELPPPMSGQRIKPRHLSIRDIREKLAGFEKDRQTAEDIQAISTAFALTMGEFEELAESSIADQSARISGSESNTFKHNTELHNRFALSCSCFFFALLGGPFSIMQARRQFLTTFFMCFLPILLVYYPVVLLMMSLAKAGSVDPAWGMWVGNGILLVGAIIVLRCTVRR
ncbi:MAG: LptF/LptG family permease [Planctomycetota bacterium]|nr:LptF/LptG family permease [Planctomycetota bacterium]